MYFINLVSFLFLFASIILSLTYLYKLKPANINDDEFELIRYISRGARIVLKRFFKFGLVTVILFCLFTYLVNLALLPELPQRFLFIVLGASSAAMIGQYCLQLSISSIKHLLSSVKISKVELISIFHSRSTFIMTFILSLALIDLYTWYFILDYLLHINFNNLAYLCAKFFHFEWTPELNQSITYLNHRHLFVAVIMSSYAAGSVLQVFLARINLGLFATAFDASADLIGYRDYNLKEDDLRNPASIPDQIGDQLKGNFLKISEFFFLDHFPGIRCFNCGGDCRYHASRIYRYGSCSNTPYSFIFWTIHYWGWIIYF